jgi:molybdopterin-guanine dinucleotide biosynthesis protein A
MTLHEFLEASISKDELEFLQEKEKQKVVKSVDGVILKRSKEFEEHFMDIQTKEDRNFAILNAYLEVSKSLISKVVKSGDSCTGV